MWVSVWVSLWVSMCVTVTLGMRGSLWVCGCHRVGGCHWRCGMGVIGCVGVIVGMWASSSGCYFGCDGSLCVSSGVRVSL